MVEVDMASKMLAAIAIILLIAVVVFFVDTRLLLEPIFYRFSPHEPGVAYNAVLWVEGQVDEANSTEGSYAIAYSISNLRNVTAENVTLIAVFDGEQRASKLIPSLEG